MDDLSKGRPICHVEPLTVAPGENCSPSFPEASETRFGFYLLAELGRGTFGRAFLAKEESLAHRLVVLKVGTDLSDESRKLARLQHPNIVPVYSFHREGALQAVCMPYLGPVTLAHLLERVTGQKMATRTGVSITRVFAECQRSLHPFADSTIRNSCDRTKRDGEPSAPAPEQLPEVPSEGGAGFASLGDMTYVDAVLVIVSQLAEGLSRAHEQGIVHCDLKPANVLLSDDGRPMLLDFSVAFDLAARSRTGAFIGGTLPYMSPEQIRSVQARTIRFDGRSDLFALGVILYELLAGRPPFGNDRSPSASSVAAALAARLGPLPRLRDRNPAVSPALEALVQHCLEPDPQRRYQTARELHEDLCRQLSSRPLRYAPNPSRTERVRKWTWRHRVVLIVCLLLGLTAGAFVVSSAREALRTWQQEEQESANLADRFLAQSNQALFPLAMASVDPTSRLSAQESAENALDRYGARDSEHWWASSAALRRLSPTRQREVREAVSGLYWHMTASLMAQARALPGPQRDGLLRRAEELNRRAELSHPAPEESRPVWSQRAALARLAGDKEGAARWAAEAHAIPLSTAHDCLCEGRELLSEGKASEALRAIEQAVVLAPREFWPRYYLGVCYQALRQDAEAAAAYEVCAALEPSFEGTWYNRGLARLRLRDFARAEEDFDRVIRARPGLGEVYVNRALAREGLKRYAQATADLDRALELRYSPVMVRLLRARLHHKAGDPASARRDRVEGLRLRPDDEHGWVARGGARMLEAPAEALGDFEEALRHNPRSLPALQNKAHVLSRLGRNQEAIEVLTTLIGFYPTFVDARSGRGVLHARLNNRKAAVEDAVGSLRLSDRPPTQYQVAGIYAMTSRAQAEDRDEAFRLLALALRAGFGFDYLARDRELDPIRNDPKFKQVIEAARAHLAKQASERPADR
jgi:serine/threonine protein kinase/tetratricopeptide (TPR) repeat protein